MLLRMLAFRSRSTIVDSSVEPIGDLFWHPTDPRPADAEREPDPE